MQLKTLYKVFCFFSHVHCISGPIIHTVVRIIYTMTDLFHAYEGRHGNECLYVGTSLFSLVPRLPPFYCEVVFAHTKGRELGLGTS